MAQPVAVGVLKAPVHFAFALRFGAKSSGRGTYEGWRGSTWAPEQLAVGHLGLVVRLKFQGQTLTTSLGCEQVPTCNNVVLNNWCLHINEVMCSRSGKIQSVDGV